MALGYCKAQPAPESFPVELTELCVKIWQERNASSIECTRVPTSQSHCTGVSSLIVIPIMHTSCQVWDFQGPAQHVMANYQMNSVEASLPASSYLAASLIIVVHLLIIVHLGRQVEAAHDHCSIGSNYRIPLCNEESAIMLQCDARLWLSSQQEAL